MSDEAWTVVRGKRRSRNKAPACHNGHLDHQSHSETSSEALSSDEIAFRVEKLHDAFAETSDSVRHSDFFRRIQALISSKDLQSESELAEAATDDEELPSSWRWDNVTQIVIFGLGSLNSHPAPRYQLALALLLAEFLPGLKIAVEAYDPVFDAVDKAFLHRVGVKVLVENEEGKHVAMSPTLFYLPHCDGGLCGNLLQANAGSLGSIAILGNSFRSYYDQWTWKDDAAKQQSNEDWGWGPIVDLVEHKGVIEKTVSDRDFAAISTSRPFNDTSLHLFLKPLQRRQGSDEQARAGGAL